MTPPEIGTPSNALLRRVADDRDEAAFDILFDRYATEVRDLTARLGGDADPEDITQEIFAKLWSQPQAFIKYTDSDESLGAALRTAARNRFRDMKRLKSVSMAAPLPEDSERESAFATEALPLPFDEKIHEEAMQALGPRDRRLVEGHYLERKSYIELARLHAEPSDDAVRKRIERALEKLKEYLLKIGITSSTLAKEIQILKKSRPVSRRRSTLGNRRNPAFLAGVALSLLSIFMIPLLLNRQPSEVNRPTTNAPPTSLSQAQPPPGTLIPQPPPAVAQPNPVAPQARPAPSSHQVVGRTFVKKTLTVGESGSSAGDPFLDQAGVREAIAAWRAQHNRIEIEHQTGTLSSLTLGESFQPGESYQEEAIPTALTEPLPPGGAIKPVAVGLTFVSDVWRTLRMAEDPNGRWVKGEPDNKDAEEPTRILFVNWKTVETILIRRLEVGDDRAALHFTAVAKQSRIEQDGYAVLHLIISTPMGNVWGADKLIIRPPRKS